MAEGRDNSFIKDSFIYGIGNAVSLLAPVIITPFLTRAFTVSEYGMIDLIYATALIISLLAGLNLEASLLRFYYDGGEKRNLVVSAVFIYSAVSSVIFCALSAFLFAFFRGFIFNTPQELGALRIALISVPFMVIWNNQLTLLRAQRQARVFVYMSIASLAASLSLVILFVKTANLGIKAVFMGMLLSQILMCSAGFLYLRKNFIARLSSGLFVIFKDKLLPYSLPLVMPLIIATFLGNISKYFLRFYEGPSAVGVYSIALKVGGLIGLAGTSFRQAWFPYSYSIMQQENAKEKYARAFNVFIILFFALALLTVVFARQLVLLLSTSSYLEARPVVGYICLGIIFVNLSGSFFNLGIHIRKRTLFLLAAYLAGFLANIALNMLLIPRYSIAGAAVSLLSGCLVTAIMLLYFSNRIYRIPYNLKLLFCLAVLYFAFVFIYNRGA